MSKKILKYLIFTFCIFIAMQNTSDSPSDGRRPDSYEYATARLSADSFTISETDSEINAPRPTSLSNTPRVHAQTKRPCNVGNSGHTLIKSGKLINKNTTSSYQINIMLFPSGFSDHNHHLINLGKLII